MRIDGSMYQYFLQKGACTFIGAIMQVVFQQHTEMRVYVEEFVERFARQLKGTLILS